MKNYEITSSGEKYFREIEDKLTNVPKRTTPPLDLLIKVDLLDDIVWRGKVEPLMNEQKAKQLQWLLDKNYIEES